METGPTIGSMIGFSWEKSTKVLFPFHLNRWFKILIIVWLAAAGVPGCNLNFQKPAKAPKEKIRTLQQTSKQDTFSAPAGIARVSRGASSGPLAPSGVPSPEPSVTTPISQNPGNPVVLYVLIIGGGLVGVGFGILFVWLSCRFHFVMLDVLVTREVMIREPFRQHKEIGHSYFKWSAAFLGIGLGAVLIAGISTVFLMGFLKGRLALSIMAGSVGGLLTVALFLGMVSIGMVAHDFVSPIMYREKISMKESWDKFFGAPTFHIQGIVKYILVVMALSIAATVIQSIVSIVVAIAGMLVGGLLIIPGIILIKIIPLIKFPLIILGAGLGVGLIFTVLLVIGMVMLPIALFFRTFALTYVTRFYPECDLLNFKAQS